jgi:hypothetical protein
MEAIDFPETLVTLSDYNTAPHLKKKTVALVCERTILAERPPLVRKVSATPSG